MELLALVLAAGIDWRPWSTDTLDRARREAKPLLLVVAAGTEDPSRPVPEEGVLAPALERFDAVRVEAAERPDLADIARLAATLSSDAEVPPPGASLWAAFTPSLHPIAAGEWDGALTAGLAARLSSIAADYADRRAETETRAGIAAARLVAAQAPEPPHGALDAAAIDRALAGIRDGGPPTPGALRLLFAERSQSPTAATRSNLSRALTALLAAPVGRTVGEEALRLRFLSDGFAATALPALREAAEASATRLLGERDPGGTFTRGGRDPRVFAFENGLAVSALVASASTMGRTADRDAAVTAAAALQSLGPWSALARCAGASVPCCGAFLEDYAFLAEAFLDLYDSTGEARWRDEARSAVDVALGRFLDTSAGGFFDTDAAHVPLPARLKSGYDGARPSPNGVMASVLLRLARATGERRYADLARGTLDAFRGDLQRAPRGMETMAASAVPFVGATSSGVARESARPSRETHGPVTVEALLDSPRARPAGRLEASVRLTIAPPWTLSGHRPDAVARVPLAVSVPGDRFAVGPVTYPREAVLGGTAVVVVPLRVRADVPAGPAAVRLTIRFQRCRGAECQAPESVILEAPLVVEAPER